MIDQEKAYGDWFYYKTGRFPCYIEPLNTKKMKEENECPDPEKNETEASFYRDLLKKYMKHIIACEGISFVDHSGYGDGEKFTEQETEALEEIEKEAKKEI